MKKSSSQFFVCKQGCFSLDPNFKCAHEGGRSVGSGDDIVLILDDEPGDAGRSPGEKIAAARERERERYERRGQATANRRAMIREILLNLRAGLQKSKQWRDLMYMPEFVQLPEDCRWWPIKAAWTVKNLVQLLDEKSWSDSK